MLRATKILRAKNSLSDMPRTWNLHNFSLNSSVYVFRVHSFIQHIYLFLNMLLYLCNNFYSLRNNIHLQRRCSLLPQVFSPRIPACLSYWPKQLLYIAAVSAKTKPVGDTSSLV